MAATAVPAASSVVQVALVVRAAPLRWALLAQLAVRAVMAVTVVTLLSPQAVTAAQVVWVVVPALIPKAVPVVWVLTAAMVVPRVQRVLLVVKVVQAAPQQVVRQVNPHWAVMAVMAVMAVQAHH
jgi:hypothetical protein